MYQIILFWNDTLHVSDGLSVHHQEFQTIHTATGICQTDTAVCLLASRQQYLFDKTTRRLVTAQANHQSDSLNSKVVPVRAVQAYVGSGVTVPFILDFGSRLCESSASRP